MRTIRDFIHDFYESEKFRILNFVPVAMGAGICSYFYLDKEPDFLFSIFCVLISSALAVNFRKKIFYALLIFCVGFLIAQIKTMSVNTPLLQKKFDDPIAFFATIESCNRTESGLSFIVKDANCPFKSDKIFLSWKGEKAKNSNEHYSPGDRISVFANLAPLNNQAFPEYYDFKKQQYFNHISARGFILSAPKKVGHSFPDGSFDLFVEKSRHKINEKIDETLSADTAAVAKAIITGTKSSIRKDLRESFSRSGTAYILAISGLHMGIIGLLIFEIARLILNCFASISMFYSVKKIAAAISLIGVIIYYFISGCSVSSLRALLMHGLIIFGILLSRRALTMRSVAIAATIILLISPEVIMFPSFQLSFSAVIAIVAFYEKCRDFVPRFQMLFNVVATTFVASLATSIFSIFVFNQLTLNSVFANIFTIPLMTFFIMPMAIISLIFLTVNITFPLKILAIGINGLIHLAEFSAKLPGSLFIMATPLPLALSVIVFSGLLFTLIQHRARYLGVLGIFVGCLIYYFEETPLIVISPQAKAFGVKVDDNLTCFNHCGYFKSIMGAWSKSVGCEKRENFNSKSCRKFIEKLDDSSVKVKLKNQEILLISDQNSGNLPNFSKKSDSFSIFLDKNCDFTREIYFPSLKEKSNKQKNRPWNRNSVIEQ